MIASYPKYKQPYISVMTVKSTNRYQMEQKRIERKKRINHRNKMKHIRQIIMQKLLGLAIIAISFLVVFVGHMIDKDGTMDITFMFITIPVGIYLIFTKRFIFSKTG